MASINGWLKNQAKGLRSFAGSPGANAYNNVGFRDAPVVPQASGFRDAPVVAQASGFAGDPNFLRQVGGGNSVGGSSILSPKGAPGKSVV